jgi:uncharacterized protein with PIN domain
MDSPNEMRFAVENTLGKLAKWLRILGFDAFYKPDLSAEKLMDIRTGRILLTRTGRIRFRNTSQKRIFITSDNSFEQLREVIVTLDIAQKDVQLFSRCVRCNTMIRKVGKDSIRKMVPDYIWETHDAFCSCTQCGRIYWPGSHTRRSRDIIKRLFK